MRLILTAALAAFALPAVAQEQTTTLRTIISKGQVMKAFGMDIPIQYTADGKWAAPSVNTAGTWRIDGERLCTKTTESDVETCATYPAGKKSGDTFEVPGAMGPSMGTVTVRIN